MLLFEWPHRTVLGSFGPYDRFLPPDGVAFPECSSATAEHKLLQQNLGVHRLGQVIVEAGGNC